MRLHSPKYVTCIYKCHTFFQQKHPCQEQRHLGEIAKASSMHEVLKSDGRSAKSVLDYCATITTFKILFMVPELLKSKDFFGKWTFALPMQDEYCCQEATAVYTCCNGPHTSDSAEAMRVSSQDMKW